MKNQEGLFVAILLLDAIGTAASWFIPFPSPASRVGQTTAIWYTQHQFCSCSKRNLQIALASALAFPVRA